MGNKNDEYLTGLLSTLSHHIGREKAIPMTALQTSVFGEEAGDKINGTRTLRKLITAARLRGVPIASCTDRDGGGYYLAAAGSEMDDYLNRVRSRGMAALKLEAVLRRLSLPELLGQISMRLEDEA